MKLMSSTLTHSRSTNKWDCYTIWTTTTSSKWYWTYTAVCRRGSLSTSSASCRLRTGVRAHGWTPWTRTCSNRNCCTTNWAASTPCYPCSRPGHTPVQMRGRNTRHQSLSSSRTTFWICTNARMCSDSMKWGTSRLYMMNWGMKYCRTAQTLILTNWLSTWCRLLHIRFISLKPVVWKI